MVYSSLSPLSITKDKLVVLVTKIKHKFGLLLFFVYLKIKGILLLRGLFYWLENLDLIISHCSIN